MPQPRPKILIRFTVPTGGWIWKWYAEHGKAGETAITCTIPAGNYYMGDDQQADCFLLALGTVAVVASRAAGYDYGPTCWIDDDHKVKIGFDGADYHGGDQQSVSIAWTENDGAAIAAVLGFDSSADDDSDGTDNAIFTGDYHHAYGWYADEDGLLGNDLAEDAIYPNVAQSRAIAGHVKTQHLGSHHANMLGLQFVTQAKMFSGGQEYTETAVYPYERNEGLECWYREARKGTPFRIYRHHRKDVTLAAERGYSSFVGADALTYTDAGKAWDEEPQRWAGAIFYMPGVGGEGYMGIPTPVSWYIESNTDNDIVMNSHPIGYIHNSNADPTVYAIFDMRYKTYVLDMGGGRAPPFEPSELPNIARFDYNMRLLRYVS